MPYYDILSHLRGITGRFPLMGGDLHIQSFDYLTPESMDFNHAHSCHEIFFVLSGSVEILSSAGVFSLSKGDLLYMSPNIYHSCRFLPDERYAYVALDFDIGERRSSTLDSRRAQQFVDEEERLLAGLLEKTCVYAKDTCGCMDELRSICKSLSRAKTGEYTKIKNYLSNFFLCAIQSLGGAEEHEDFSEAVFSSMGNKAVRIRSYMVSHCDQPLTVQSVSSALSYSPRHVQRIISDYYGISFSRMLTECRLNRIKWLLSHTDESLDYICEESGINSSASLYKLFKKNTGMSPTEYRKNCEKQVI